MPIFEKLRKSLKSSSDPYSTAARVLDNPSQKKKREGPKGLGPSSNESDKAMYELSAARANENYNRMSKSSYASQAYPPKKKKKGEQE